MIYRNLQNLLVFMTLIFQAYSACAQSEEDQLLFSISSNPDDDTTRLVYADWIDERPNQTNTGRAEFIRLQIELERLKKNVSEQTPENVEKTIQIEKRLEEIWTLYGEQWESDSPAYSATSQSLRIFRRGFVSKIQIRSEW